MPAGNSGMRVAVISVLALLFCGCAVNSRFGKNRLLTQKQIVGKWIEGSPKPITYRQLCKEKGSSRLACADCILLPNDSDISIDALDTLFCPWAPGGPCWHYRMPDINMQCYLQLVGGIVFPVSSKGVMLDLQAPAYYEMVAEDIYLVTDTIVCHYDSLHLADAGWVETGRNTFTFNIPPNTSGRERFWQVNLYNKNREDDIRVNRGSAPYIDDEEVPEEYKKCHPAISKLRFIQVTDSFNPASLNEAYYRRYTKKLPYPNKTNYD